MLASNGQMIYGLRTGNYLVALLIMMVLTVAWLESASIFTKLVFFFPVLKINIL